jgi:hypothetical protein
MEPQIKTVTAGRILGDKVEINGLEDGEQVIVTGQINLQEEAVEVIK